MSLLPQHRPPRRRGTTVVEVTIALALLAAAASVMVQLHLVASRQQRRAEQRAAATQALANWMERCAQVAFADVEEERLTKLASLESLQQRWPHVEPVASVAADEGAPAGKRVTLELRWPAADGVAHENVQLTAWRYEVETNVSAEEEAP